MDPLDRIVAIEKLLSEGAPSQEEIAHAFEIVLVALEEMVHRYESGDEKGLHETARSAQVLRNEMRASDRVVSERATAAVDALRKVLGPIEAWVNEQKGKETEEDVAVAHDRLDMAESSIVDLRRTIKKIKQGLERPGQVPDHEWDGTRIRFELPDGSWGEWVDLRGMPGVGGGFEGGAMGGVRRIRAGTGILVSGDPGEPTITSTTTGSTQTIEAPSGTVNDSNLAFVFTAKPFLIVVNQQTFRENHGWTWNSGTATATLDNVVGTNGEIFGLIQ